MKLSLPLTLLRLLSVVTAVTRLLLPMPRHFISSFVPGNLNRSWHLAIINRTDPSIPCRHTPSVSILFQSASVSRNAKVTNIVLGGHEQFPEIRTLVTSLEKHTPHRFVMLAFKDIYSYRLVEFLPVSLRSRLSSTSREAPVEFGSIHIGSCCRRCFPTV